MMILCIDQSSILKIVRITITTKQPEKFIRAAGFSMNFGHTEPSSSDNGYQSSRSDVVVEINLDLKLVSTSQSVKNLKYSTSSMPCGISSSHITGEMKYSLIFVTALQTFITFLGLTRFCATSMELIS